MYESGLLIYKKSQQEGIGVQTLRCAQPALRSASSLPKIDQADFRAPLHEATGGHRFGHPTPPFRHSRDSHPFLELSPGKRSSFML